MTADREGQVVDWLAVAAQRRGMDSFIERDPLSWSFSWCDLRASRVAGALLDMGVRKGERVALWGANDLESVVATFAIPRSGAALVPINTRLTASEVEAQLEAADVSVVLTSAEAPPFPIRYSSTIHIESLDGPAAGEHWHDEEDEFAVVFTSGTSGPAKGVRLPWRAIEASAAGSAEHLHHSESDRWLAVLPLYHIGGISILIRSARQASSVVLPSEFSGQPIGELLTRCTIASLVPTQLVRLLDEDEERDFPDLKAILLGGGPVPPGLVERAAERGLPVLVTYGQTEAASQIATAPLDAPGLRKARPIGSLEVRVVDDSGLELPPGNVGAIEVRGNELFSGYLRGIPHDPGAWHRTGDLGEIDWDGLLSVTDRLDRVIVTGGENVHPREVEDALVEAGAVEACVVGLEDAEWGKVIAAAVVGALTPDELEGAVRGFLAGYKVPKQWLVVDDLPRNSLGKVVPDEVTALFG